MEKRPNIKLTLDQGLAVARDVRPDRSSEALASILGVERACLLRRSVDARRKSDVHFVVTVGVGGGEGAPQPVVPIEERPLPERQSWSERAPPVCLPRSSLPRPACARS